MNMRLNSLAASIALVTLAGTASAGILPSNYGFAGGVAVDLEVKIAGASAPDVALKDLISDVCQAGTLTTFTDTAGKDVGSSYSAYFCTINPAKITGLTGANASGNPVGSPNVLFRKRSAGGSFNGTLPVANADATQTQMNITNTNCAVDGAVTGRYVCSAGSTFTVAPDIGTSDLPPGEFVSPNVATGAQPCDAACVANLTPPTGTAFSNYALTMGIIADTSLYAALQAAQGLQPDLYGWDAVNHVATVGADGIPDVKQQYIFVANDPANPTAAEQARISAYIANMPSLRESQVASLMAGSIYRWNKVFYNGTALTATAGVTAPTDQRVYICRRVAGSGTQSAINALFMNVPCSAAADFPKVDNTSCVTATGTVGTGSCTGATWSNPVGASTLQAVIHEGSGSGDVDNCLSALNDHVENPAQPIWGIGIMGLDRSPIAKLTTTDLVTYPQGIKVDDSKVTKWSFIKINGVEPTLSRVASGQYPMWAGESMQVRPSLSGDIRTIANSLYSNSSKPAELNKINQSLLWPFGLSGALDLLATSPDVVRPFNKLLPEMQYTRGGKTCNTNKAISASNASGLGVDFDN